MLGKYLDFSCSASSPGDGHGRKLDFGTCHISFTVKKSVYLIKFPLSLVFSFA